MQGQDSFNYGQNYNGRPMPRGYPQEDNMTGEFGMWQPSANQRSQNSSANYSDTSYSNDASWQANRDNALNEAYRSVSQTPAPSYGQENNGQFQGQYSMSSYGRPTYSPQNNNNALSNLPQQQYSMQQQHYSQSNPITNVASSSMNQFDPNSQRFGQQNVSIQQSYQQDSTSVSRGYGQPNASTPQGYSQSNALTSHGYGQPNASTPQGYSQLNATPHGYGQPNASTLHGHGRSNTLTPQDYGQQNASNPQSYSQPNTFNSQSYHQQNVSTPPSYNIQNSSDSQSCIQQNPLNSRTYGQQNASNPLSYSQQNTLNAQAYDQQNLQGYSQGAANVLSSSSGQYHWSTADGLQDNKSNDWNQSFANGCNSTSYLPQNVPAKIYTNPLAGDEEDGASAEKIIERLHESAAQQKEKLSESYNPPSGFSKASMAVLRKDLEAAAAPFESVETLKKFRDLQLGFTDQQQQNDNNLANFSLNQYSKSKLSAEAPEFIPRTKVQSEEIPQVDTKEQEELDSKQEVEALNATDVFISQLVVNPGIFNDTVDIFVELLKSCNLSHSAISLISEKIFEMCVLEKNFYYIGSLLCDKLSRKQAGLLKFRTCLLTKAQKEFHAMDQDLNSDKNAQRARNFTQFTSELFLNLMCERENRLERFAVLGRGTFGVVRKLIDHPSDVNIQCAVRVLKGLPVLRLPLYSRFCVASNEQEPVLEKDLKTKRRPLIEMPDSLKNDGKGSIEKLNAILNDLEAVHNKTKYADINFNELTCNLLAGLVKLREQNWGRESRPSSSSSSESRLCPPELLQKQDENYYMNEPVFFTPSGKQYTAADAADPDFYNTHLAQYNTDYHPQDHSSQNSKQTSDLAPTTVFNRNPLSEGVGVEPESSYSTWSPAGEADQLDPACAEDDYDADYEDFLQHVGQ